MEDLMLNIEVQTNFHPGAPNLGQIVIGKKLII